MAFDVVPAEIRAHAGTYRDLASDTDVARTYVDSHVDLPDFEGVIYPLIKSNVIGVKLDLRNVLDRLDRILYNANLELFNVARLYEETDAAQAAAQDAHYEHVDAPAERYADKAPSVTDTVPEDTE